MADLSLVATIGNILLVVIAGGTIVYNSGKTTKEIENLSGAMRGDIKPELTRLNSRIDGLLQQLAQDRISVSHSPRVLNDRGEEILRQSGIGSIVRANIDDIALYVKQSSAANPYQAQQFIIEAVASLATDPKIRDHMEIGAYKSGSTLEEVVLVGALYIRDDILSRLNMNPGELAQES